MAPRRPLSRSCSSRRPRCHPAVVRWPARARHPAGTGSADPVDRSQVQLVDRPPAARGRPTDQAQMPGRGRGKGDHHLPGQARPSRPDRDVGPGPSVVGDLNGVAAEEVPDADPGIHHDLRERLRTAEVDGHAHADSGLLRCSSGSRGCRRSCCGVVAPAPPPAMTTAASPTATRCWPAPWVEHRAVRQRVRQPPVVHLDLGQGGHHLGPDAGRQPSARRPAGPRPKSRSTQPSSVTGFTAQGRPPPVGGRGPGGQGRRKVPSADLNVERPDRVSRCARSAPTNRPGCGTRHS